MPRIIDSSAINRLLLVMLHSVDLIQRVTEIRPIQARHAGSVQRNVRHLEIMLENPSIQSDGISLELFKAAIAQGRDWLTLLPKEI